MNKITIKGDSKPISIEYEEFAQGSKNATLPLIGASLIFDSKQILSNFPDISDVKSIFELLDQINIQYEFKDGVFIKNNSSQINKQNFGSNFFKTRGGFYIVAGIISKFGRVEIEDYVVGGCKIGDRNYQFIFNTFKSFGIDVEITDKSIIFQKQLENSYRREIVLDDLGIVVTGIALILAAQEQSPIKLINISNAPEINDVIDFLIRNGISIERLGKRDLLVNPVVQKDLYNETDFQIQDDRIVIATYSILSLITKGKFRIKQNRWRYLDTFTSLLKDIGFVLESNEDNFIIYNKDNLELMPQNVIADDYPAISTDMQPLVTLLLCTINGNSTMTDKIFPTRNFHVEQLSKLNQKIEFTDDRIVIKGRSKFLSNEIESNDMRCSAALILAATIAEGTSTIKNYEDVNRGYEHLISIVSQNRQTSFS
jgi:UDP-N-acetylglucosamine 1-carboxyvinyltransferase